MRFFSVARDWFGRLVDLNWRFIPLEGGALALDQLIRGWGHETRLRACSHVGAIALCVGSFAIAERMRRRDLARDARWRLGGKP